MGDKLDILSCFTVHSSNCLFTSWYVQCVCVFVISAFLCPCPSLSAFSVRSVLYVPCMAVTVVQASTCVSVHVLVHECVCVFQTLPAVFPWTQLTISFFYQPEPEPEKEGKL